MSPEAQRVAIAEVCGYQWWTFRDGSAILIEAGRNWPETCNFGGVRALSGIGLVNQDETTLPDYLNDLNAMHEAEEAIIERGLMYAVDGYHNTLCNLIDNGNAIRARSGKRAEAFLRTLGLWRED